MIPKFQERHLLNALACVASVLFAAACLEIGVRLLLPEYNPSNHFSYILSEDKPPLGPPFFVGRQWQYGDFDVHIRINKYGLRDKKDLANSTSEDIFVVGDSYSFGYGVEEEDRYSNALETMLHVPVYNIATVGDFDTYEDLIHYAEKKGARIKSLIVGVCMENDMLFYTHPHEKYAARPARFEMLRQLRNLLSEHSAAYNCIKAQMFKLKSFQRQFISMKLDNDAKAKVNEQGRVEKESVDRLLKITSKYHSIVLIIPSRGALLGDKDEVAFHDKFVSSLKKKNFSVVDVFEYLRKDPHPLSYHYKFDGHWNKKGHALAATLLRKVIEENALREN